LKERLKEAYAAHQYHVVYHGLHNFCSVKLSSFYFDIIKDRLYTMPEGHPARRAGQTVLYRLADALCRLMAPVLCFTAEEVWQELETLRGGEPWDGVSVHTELFPEALEIERQEELDRRFEKLIELREEVYRALEIARQDKMIGTGLEACVVVESDEESLGLLKSFGDELKFLFITSEVEFGPVGANAFRSEAVPGFAVEVRKAAGEKCARCWNYTTDVGAAPEWPAICARCAGHVREILG
jgi:isoleucyl-tRNA synthetase